MPYPAAGETPQHGGAELVGVGPPTVLPFGIGTVARPFDLPAGAVDTDGVPSAVRLDDSTVTVTQTRAAHPAAGVTKTAEVNDTRYEFHASGVIAAVGCDHTAPTWDRWYTRAVDRVTAAAPAALAARLWLDTTNAGTPLASNSLMRCDGATDLTTAQHPMRALGDLIDSYCQITSTPGDAILHVPPILLPAIRSVCTVVNGQLRGPNDTPISVGPYPSDIGVDGAAPNTGQTVIAVSGPVWAQIGSAFEAANPDGVPAAVVEGRTDPRTNRNQIWVEKRLNYAFDPTSVVRAVVFIPAPTAGGEGG